MKVQALFRTGPSELEPRTERCSSVTLVQGQLLFVSLNFTSFLSWLNTPWYGLHMPFHSLKPLHFITFNTVALRGLIKEMEDSSPCDARPLLALQWTGTEPAPRAPGRTGAYSRSRGLRHCRLPLELCVLLLHTKNISVNLMLELLLKETQQQNLTC